MKITNSMAKTYTQCRKLYDYKFNSNLEPKSAPLPMYRGNWLHLLLEAHYLHEGGWEHILDNVLLPEWNRLFDEEKEMYGDLPKICSHIMESYEYFWREEDSKMEVIAGEEVVEVPLARGHTFQFRFDLITEDEWGRWLWEHKSHKRIPSADYRFIDIQTTRYLWALNKIKRYGEITGVLWNYIRTKEPTVPKLNKDGTLSKRKIETDLFTFVTTIKEYRLDPGNYRDVILRLKEHNPFFRRERVPRPKEVVETLVKELVYVAEEIERGFPIVRSIDRMCENCSFLEPCITNLYGGDEESVLRAKYRLREEDEYHGDQVEAEEELVI